MVKIRILDGELSETVWASKLDDGCFRLENPLFVVYGYALGDVVDVSEAKAGDAIPIVHRVVRRSGHSSYRIFLDENANSIENAPMWGALNSLGCTYERGTKRLFAVDVPATTSIYEAHGALESGEVAGEWSFEEVFCGHRLN